MIKPNFPDNISHYLLLPMGLTLYGYESKAEHWLRVGDVNQNHIYTEYVINDNKYFLETIGLQEFILFLTYGYTPFLEVVYSGYQHGIDLGSFRQILVTQSALRNYEKRANILFEIAKNKQHSPLTRFDEKSREIMAELQGVMFMWEELMSSGEIKAKDCLLEVKNAYALGINLELITKNLDDVKARMYYSNSVKMQVKTLPDQRNLLLKAFGLD